MKIRNIDSFEILDSRGTPTVMTSIELEDGTLEFGYVPSGASTGSREAIEKRDGGSSFVSMHRIETGSLTSSGEYHTTSVSQFLNVTSTDDIKLRLRSQATTQSDTVFMSANSSEPEHIVDNVETTILFNKVAPMVSS